MPMFDAKASRVYYQDVNMSIMGLSSFDKAFVLDGKIRGLAFQIKTASPCPTCKSPLHTNGHDLVGRLRWKCPEGHHFTACDDRLGLVDYQTGDTVNLPIYM